MPIDGVMLHALCAELTAHSGARLDRITQPERDEVILYFYSKGENRRLLLSASSSNPRIQWVGYPKENPAYAPNFCMLLRKHLTGARLLEVFQPGLERVAVLRFDCRNDFYEAEEKRLILELIGRSGNLILTDGNGRIFDALRQVDLTALSPRKILPGMHYEYPPSQSKHLLLEDCEVSLPEDSVRLDRFLTGFFEGFSPLLSREISYRLTGRCDPMLSELSETERLQLPKVLDELKTAMQSGRYVPTVLKTETAPKDFYCFPIRQYGTAVTEETYSSCSAAMDAYYGEKDRAEHIRRHSADLSKLLSAAISRLSRKIETQRAELADTERADEYRRFGDLIVSYLYLFKGHEKSIRLPDYTFDPPQEVCISLNPSHTASRNAQTYYKKYKKAQTAKRVLNDQIILAQKELEYLRSVEDSLSRAKGIAELADLRKELAEQGYLRKQSQGKKNSKSREQSRPLRYMTSDGFTVLCGRNNLQNDTLTLRTAGARDLWFHVKNSPGSHTVLFCEGKEPSDQAMTEAAVIASTNSSLRNSDHVAVDYTQVRNVRKPAGAKPGMVIYETYRTAYVNPSEELCRSLKKE